MIGNKILLAKIDDNKHILIPADRIMIIEQASKTAINSFKEAKSVVWYRRTNNIGWSNVLVKDKVQDILTKMDRNLPEELQTGRRKIDFTAVFLNNQETLNVCILEPQLIDSFDEKTDESDPKNPISYTEVVIDMKTEGLNNPQENIRIYNVTEDGVTIHDKLSQTGTAIVPQMIEEAE
jgi:hypothetical protein